MLYKEETVLLLRVDSTNAQCACTAASRWLLLSNNNHPDLSIQSEYSIMSERAKTGMRTKSFTDFYLNTPGAFPLLVLAVALERATVGWWTHWCGVQAAARLTRFFHLLETSGGKDPFSKLRLDTLSSNEGTLILCEAEDNMGHHSAELPVWWVLPGRGT